MSSHSRVIMPRFLSGKRRQHATNPAPTRAPPPTSQPPTQSQRTSKPEPQPKAESQAQAPSQHPPPSIPVEHPNLAGIQLSEWSTSAVPNSAWASTDFMLGTGMVAIQENTEKILLVYETREKYWFFPRGRKDMGETFEQAAVREAYEESGYRVEFLPLYHPHHQPPPPGISVAEARMMPSTEPIFMTFRAYQRNSRHNPCGEYLTMWYAGTLPEDAVREEDTGMPNEKHYESYLLSYEDAIQRVFGQEVPVLEYVWACWLRTKEARTQLAAKEAEAGGSGSDSKVQEPGPSQGA